MSVYPIRYFVIRWKQGYIPEAVPYSSERAAIDAYEAAKASFDDVHLASVVDMEAIDREAAALSPTPEERELMGRWLRGGDPEALAQIRDQVNHD